jgi:hypothetical protein
MNARRMSIMAMILAVAGAQGAQAAPARNDGYVLRGPVQVLSARPSNPAGKDRFMTRIAARVEQDAKGQPVVVLTHVWSGQSCRFEAWRSRLGRLLLDGAAPCRFTALSSPGELSVAEGTIVESGGRMRLEGTFDIKWLFYRGSIRVTAAGGAAVAAR